jgi:serine O-acetyltransferase
LKLRDQTLQGLVDYTCAQVANLTPDGRTEPLRTQVARHADAALERVGACIDAVRMWTPGVFDYLHSSQYCQYLYYLANTIWREEGEEGRGAATRLFLLNKALNGIDLFYEIEMPRIFFIGHSVGIVLSKATYGDYLVLYQNVTVGKNHGVAPVIGEGVVLYPSSAVIGRCRVADGSVLAQGVGVVNQDTPGNCMVFAGEGGRLTFKPATRDVRGDLFR